jgi:glutamate/tyrosine decarboxylase-like PLP-dependent enzyme
MQKSIWPEKTSTKDQIISELKQMRTKDIRWQDGKCFCLVFHGGDDVYEVMKEAYSMYISENALNPTAFPSLKKMENEVVSMVKALLGDDKESCGVMTSGGTESILMAVKCAREWARDKKPKIKEPEIIAPISVHPAFNKACHYFGIKLVTIDVDPVTFKADIEEMKAKINSNTIMLVGSSPSYPQGVMDPLVEIGKLALENEILCHSDSCIGGMALGFYREIGIDVVPFDLKVPGVTSLSVDLHKYGYAAKGASVVLYKTRELRKYQFFCTTNWTGGIYISPSALGTRAGGSIAAAWAVMNYLGKEGYHRICRSVFETTNSLISKINSVDGLYILGKPEASLISFGSKNSDIYVVADYMTDRGWHFDKNNVPASIHLTVMYAHAKSVDNFIKDLTECQELAKSEYTSVSNMKKSLVNTMVRMMPSKLVKKIAGGQVKDVGNEDSNAPQKTAGIYGLMGSLEQKGALKDVAINLLDNLYDN